MRHRDDWHRNAGEEADLAREHPARVDDDVGLDRALVRLDADDAAVLEADPRHAGVRMDLGTAPPSAFGERERQLARVDVAVGGEEGAAQNAIGGHRREELASALGGDELEREPERLRPARLAAELLHAFLGRREAKRADLVPSGLEPHLVLERPVELDRAHHHLREADRASELPDETR